MQKKYFSLDDAQAIIPEVKEMLNKLLEIQKMVKMRNTLKIRYEDDFLDAHNSTKISMETHRYAYEFFQILDSLMIRGVFVKDPKIGLVDFYSRFGGNDIFLCYKYPEEKILYWHGLNEGYSGRKSIELLKEKI
ncbi:DUF2203 domain-containing protein [Candidatus Woesearchaeota archaeon]|nr:DUF2203 domain-containing protein [Candidatus Woesearchaeota archaeon]